MVRRKNFRAFSDNLEDGEDLPDAVWRIDTISTASNFSDSVCRILAWVDLRICQVVEVDSSHSPAVEGA